ncbi:integrase [Bartonella callosciuri]|uniref:Integrase n=1 Tax=Bartonella callosciuri TaxID=686223 RepID=A0A840NY62_9HYPH|nr:integrase [Bartonella callosciuri]
MHRGEAFRLGWKDVKENIIHLKTEKSKYRKDTFLPILAELKKILQTGPIGDETFICGKNGNKPVKESFGTVFYTTCAQASIKNQLMV